MRRCALEPLLDESTLLSTSPARSRAIPPCGRRGGLLSWASLEGERLYLGVGHHVASHVSCRSQGREQAQGCGCE